MGIPQGASESFSALFPSRVERFSSTPRLPQFFATVFDSEKLVVEMGRSLAVPSSLS